jgi:hypothetical protein
MSASFAATVGAARLLNYVRERSRPAPRLASLGRRLVQTPLTEKPRVHHFIPGFLLAFAVGGAAILRRDDGLEGWLSLPFGTGVALTFDELYLIVKRGDRYWSSENFALAQCAVASALAAALAANFARRGLDAGASPNSIRRMNRATDQLRGAARAYRTAHARLTRA